MRYLTNLLSLFYDVPTLVVSIGMIVATSSFISGLQLVRGASVVERKIHRFNGFSVLVLYVALAVLAFWYEGFRILPLLGWIAGGGVLALKISIVRGRKRRTFKYVSWLGACLICIWLFLVYMHLPA